MNKAHKLTVRAEVVNQDDLLNQRRRTSHQDAEGKRKKERDGDQKKIISVPVLSIQLRPIWLPFDGAEEGGASLIVEGDDDTRGGKVCVIIQRCTPTERRGSFNLFLFRDRPWVLNGLRRLRVHPLNRNISGC